MTRFGTWFEDLATKIGASRGVPMELMRRDLAAEKNAARLEADSQSMRKSRDIANQVNLGKLSDAEMVRDLQKKAREGYFKDKTGGTAGVADEGGAVEAIPELAPFDPLNGAQLFPEGFATAPEDQVVEEPVSFMQKMMKRPFSPEGDRKNQQLLRAARSISETPMSGAARQEAILKWHSERERLNPEGDQVEPDTIEKKMKEQVSFVPDDSGNFFIADPEGKLQFNKAGDERKAAENQYNIQKAAEDQKNYQFESERAKEKLAEEAKVNKEQSAERMKYYEERAKKTPLSAEIRKRRAEDVKMQKEKFGAVIHNKSDEEIADEIHGDWESDYDSQQQFKKSRESAVPKTFHQEIKDLVKNDYPAYMRRWGGAEKAVGERLEMLYNSEPGASGAPVMPLNDAGTPWQPGDTPPRGMVLDELKRTSKTSHLQLIEQAEAESKEAERNAQVEEVRQSGFETGHRMATRALPSTEPVNQQAGWVDGLPPVGGWGEAGAPQFVINPETKSFVEEQLDDRGLLTESNSLPTVPGTDRKRLDWGKLITPQAVQIAEESGYDNGADYIAQELSTLIQLGKGRGDKFLKRNFAFMDEEQRRKYLRAGVQVLSGSKEAQQKQYDAFPPGTPYFSDSLTLHKKKDATIHKVNPDNPPMTRAEFDSTDPPPKERLSLDFNSIKKLLDEEGQKDFMPPSTANTQYPAR